MISDQWIRKIGLFIYNEDEALDLSQFHVRFDVANADGEMPNNASIRVYNLASDTVKKITTSSEYQNVSLNAGYEGGNYGCIFQGQIKQYRVGKESATDSYLDILAADGDYSYISSFLNESVSAGQTPTQAISSISNTMGLPVNYGSLSSDLQHFPSIRGKVRFGMARAYMRNIAKTLDAGWSIQNGVIQVVDNKGCLEGIAVDMNSNHGLIGIPEQTDEGIRVKCLINSKLRIGGQIQIDNKLVNQTMQNVSNNTSKNGPVQVPAQVPYNSYRQLQPLAPLSDDGVYRLFVVEHEGDTRGGPWYSNIIGLAFDSTANITLAP